MSIYYYYYYIDIEHTQFLGVNMKAVRYTSNCIYFILFVFCFIVFSSNLNIYILHIFYVCRALGGSNLDFTA